MGRHSHLDMPSLRADGRLSLEPNLPQVKEKRVLTKQQKKLNALINLKYEIQRKTERSSMIHLTKPIDLHSYPTLETEYSKRRNITEMSILGTKNSSHIVQRLNGVGSKLFLTNSHLQESSDNSVDRPNNGQSYSSRFVSDASNNRLQKL